MSDKHIIDILDESRLSTLSESERAVVEQHAEGCSECRSALAAAYLSTALLRERAANSFTPSPFFATRVLATLRERQSSREFWGLARMWRAAGALVSAMAVTVVTLAVVTFVVPANETGIDQDLVTAYSADEVILGQSELPDEVNYGQVWNTLYGGDEEIAK